MDTGHCASSPDAAVAAADRRKACDQNLGSHVRYRPPRRAAYHLRGVLNPTCLVIATGPPRDAAIHGGQHAVGVPCAGAGCVPPCSGVFLSIVHTIIKVEAKGCDLVTFMVIDCIPLLTRTMIVLSLTESNVQLRKYMQLQRPLDIGLTD